MPYWKERVQASIRELRQVVGPVDVVVPEDKSGKFHAVEAMPKLGNLPEIIGLAEQTITDSELLRFG